MSQASGRASPTKAISTILAVLLAGVLLYFSLRKIQWQDVWTLIREAKPGYLGLCCVLISGSLLLRAIRWRILLRAGGPVPVSEAFWATSAGYFGNNFLPARGGELVRTMMISSRSALSNAFVLTTALSERVADAITLIVISALVLLILPAQLSIQSGWLAAAVKPFVALGLCGVLMIALLPGLDRFGVKILERSRMPSALRARLIVILEHSLSGIRAFHDVRRLLGFFGLTILIWCLDAISTVIGAEALKLSISFPVAFLLLAGLGLGSALPSTPGYIGIYQFVAVSVLVPFGFSRMDAIAYILVAQALSYVVYAFWGAIGFWCFRQSSLFAET